MMHAGRHSVELRQRFLPQHFGRGSRGHAIALVEKTQAIRVEAGKGEVVHCGDHGETVLTAQPVDQFQCLLLVADVEGVGRFVQQENRCLLGDGTGNDHALPFATGQFTHHPVAEVGEVETCQNIGDDVPVVLGLLAEVADERIATEHHVLRHGHVVGHHRRLRHVGHQLCPALRRAEAQRGAVDAHFARVLHESRDGAQQRTLSCTVRADEAQPLPRLHRVGERHERIAFAVAHADVDEVDRRHRDACLVRRRSRKNGAPRNAVTTPIGVSDGFWRSRPGMSARTRNVAPAKMLMGMMMR